VNVDSGPVCGAEVAGLVNFAAEMQGAQVGGIVDVAASDSSGLQVGLVDVAASRLRGLQLGLIDVAGAADAQVGLVDVGRTAKVQVGLVNVAADADVQIGLVSVDLHGRTLLDAWAKPEAGALLVGVKHGPPHMHSIYAIEMNAVTGRPWGVLGLGAHLAPAERLSVDVDLLYHVQTLPSSRVPNELSELRVVGAYAFAPHVSAFVGPTFNVLVSPEPSRADAPGYASLLGRSSTTEVRAWPGVALGVEVP
jgi:hypothetical protein